MLLDLEEPLMRANRDKQQEVFEFSQKHTNKSNKFIANMLGYHSSYVHKYRVPRESNQCLTCGSKIAIGSKMYCNMKCRPSYCKSKEEKIEQEAIRNIAKQRYEESMKC